MLGCLGFIHTLEIITRMLSEVVNRERFACSLVCWDFVHTLKIITRTLSEVVNRERLCGTNALILVASAIFDLLVRWDFIAL